MMKQLGRTRHLITFRSPLERDDWLDRNYPNRKAVSNRPGLFENDSGTVIIGVNGCRVFIFVRSGEAGNV